MTTEGYSKSPIVEAVVEFTFEENIDVNELTAALRAGLDPSLVAHEERVDEVTISAEFSPTSTSTGASRVAAQTYLRSSDQRFAIGCASSRLSVHILRPYTRWSEFRAVVASVCQAASGLRSEHTVTATTVRYIDSIEVPADAAELHEYFTGIPPRTKSIPGSLESFHVVTRIADPESGAVATQTLASGGLSAQNHPLVIYDLLFQRRSTPAPLFNSESSWAIVDELHALQKQAFEENITPRTRELFR